jgi:hypothetical protein
LSRQQESWEPERESPRTAVKAALGIWLFLLIFFWIPLAGLTESVFDINRVSWKFNGLGFEVFMFTYPVTLGIAYVFRRKVPLLSLLPLLSWIGIGVFYRGPQ